jgi:NOL1/NOP2/sun family putative RNA methylase
LKREPKGEPKGEPIGEPQSEGHRDREYPQKIIELAKDSGFSRHVISHFADIYPNEVELLISRFRRGEIPSIRVNTLKQPPKNLIEMLKEKNILLRKSRWLDYAYDVVSDEGALLGHSHEYLKGYYYIQSLSSMIPAHILCPQPGESVLDMCAAPGSKTTQLAQLMKNEGTILAVDSDKDRVDALYSNLRRCGVQNTTIMIRNAVEFKDDKLIFDKILLDAPCSGSGTFFGKQPGKQAPNDDFLVALTKLQKDLLRAGLRALKKGGLLVYSTCSLYPEENELVVNEVLKSKQSGVYELIEPWDSIGLPGLIEYKGKSISEEMLKTRRITPHDHDTEGFFYAVFRRVKE